MKIKHFVLAIALAMSANAIQAVPVTAAKITIQGGSNANAVWHAPLNQNYNVWVFVPSNATAVNAVYRLYPKGKKPNSAECSAIDFNYPCTEVAVNQALNKNKWVQLNVNNYVNTAWAFIGGKGYVTVASNALSSTENLGIAGVRFVPDYTSENWRLVMASVSAVKLSISECLNDHAGLFEPCDSTAAQELGQYGIRELPTFTNAVISLIPTTSAIQMVGDATLGGCTFQLQPDAVNAGAGMISWKIKATAVATGQVADCVKYIKGATY